MGPESLMRRVRDEAHAEDKYWQPLVRVRQRGPPGPGDVSPKPVHARSICAFSGLNDFVKGPSDFHVQSYGQDVRAGPADRTYKETAERPGFLCNPNNLSLK